MFPILGFIVMLVVLTVVLGARGPFAHFAARGSWGEPPGGRPSGESALDIVKRRYASGEITRYQFEQIRRDT